MKRRRRRSDDDWDDIAAAYRSMRKRRRPRRLYRDTERGIFGGVCAGIANYLGLEPWLIRLAFVALVLFGGLMAPLIVYIVLVFVLNPQPQYDDEWEERSERAEVRTPHVTIRTSPKLGLRVVGADLRELELRLRRLETYVTSPKYGLDKGFSDISPH